MGFLLFSFVSLFVVFCGNDFRVVILITLSYRHMYSTLTNVFFVFSFLLLVSNRFFVCVGNQFETRAIFKYFTNANATTHTDRGRIHISQHRPPATLVRNGTPETANIAIPSDAGQTWTREPSASSIQSFAPYARRRSECPSTPSAAAPSLATIASTERHIEHAKLHTTVSSHAESVWKSFDGSVATQSGIPPAAAASTATPPSPTTADESARWSTYGTTRGHASWSSQSSRPKWNTTKETIHLPLL